MRGGAFKPLTFPYRSEKYTETREDGIKWLKMAKQEFGIPVITEIMEEKYLDLICETTDILQIGSRNIKLSPFNGMCKVEKHNLKRHYGASLRDCLGAAEYLMVEGNHKIILCERCHCTSHTQINFKIFC